MEMYRAKIVGDDEHVKRAVALLGSLCHSPAQSWRSNSKELVRRTVEAIARNLAWFGRAPYEILADKKDPTIAYLASFTPRRLMVTPWFCIQMVPPRDREIWKKTLVYIPKRDLWIVEIPKELGGYWRYRRITRGLRRFGQPTPKFWRRDLGQGKTDPYFNFTEHRRETEIYECSVTRRWGWNRRDTSTRNWTEFALFYRVLTFRWAQATLRDHIILELNCLLARMNINASIRVSGLPTPENILGLRTEMVVGNISYSKAFDVTSI